MTRARPHPTSPPINPRLAATFALVPLTWGVLMVSVSFGSVVSWVSTRYSEETRLIATILLPLATYYFGSLWIWWGTVRWTARKRYGVLWASLALAALFVGASAVVFETFEVGTILLVSVATFGGGATLMIVNVVCWSRPARGPGQDTVPCPVCAHDLGDAGSCVCPACGGSFTLGELVKSTEVADAVGLGTTGPVVASEPK